MQFAYVCSECDPGFRQMPRSGFLDTQPVLAKDAVVVVLATGNGLKDPAAAGRSVEIPEKTITPLDEVR